MRTAAELRADFLLDPGHRPSQPRLLRRHASARCSRDQRELRDALERDPVEFLGRRLPELLAGVRGELAAYLGVAEPDRLVLVANATTALNAVATSLPLAPGDEVVVTDREYGAMELLWTEVARRADARLVVANVPLPAIDGTELLDAIWSAVTPRTRVLFFSHVTSETALVLPAKELCRRAREAGIISVVDGAHGPGHLPLALDDLGADCYAGNGHKWLCAPKGSGFLYVRDELQAELRPPVVTWGRDDGYVDRFGWSGTDDPTAMLSLGAAIEYQSDERLARRPGALPRARPPNADRDRRAAGRRPHRRRGAPGAADGRLRGAARRPGRAPASACETATASRSRCTPSTGRTLMRLSVAAYTTEEDCERLLDALNGP